MKVLVRDSEPYAARGNVASAGVSNQLGRPRLDPLAVFVREGVQNCWDAHLPEDPHIAIEIGVRTLSVDEAQALQSQVFADPAPETDLGERLAKAVAGEAPMRVLWITDRNTSGLGGPTRADAVSARPDVPTDFVDLLRNVGQPPDKQQGGGTFGYGKAALFLMSRVQTLLVHTHARDASGAIEPRLIGVGLGPQYVEPDPEGHERRYTGRHWWGLRAADGIVDPALGQDADALASAVGLPGFADGGSGTTVAIVDPVFPDERDPLEAMKLVVEALLWNFWPKMVAARDGRPTIEFTVRHEDAILPIPRPHDFPPLEVFVHALENVDDLLAGEEPRHFGTTIPIKRYSKWLGVLSLVRMPRARRTRISALRGLPIGGIEGPVSSHVALMRAPRLIVAYREFLPLQADNWEYAGVFLASDECDRAFAESEPPTHDDWVSAQLTDRAQRNIVRLALERLAAATREFADPTATMTQQARSEGLGPLSARLGDLLVGVTRRQEDAKPKVRKGKPRIKPESTPPEPGDAEPGGPATVGESEATTPTRKPGRPRIRLTGGELQVHDGQGVLATTFELKHGVRTNGTRLRAEGWALLPGGTREKDPPEGAPVPEVVAWIGPDGGLITEPEPLVSLDGAGAWTVLVSLLDDAAIDVAVRGDAVLPEDV